VDVLSEVDIRGKEGGMIWELLSDEMEWNDTSRDEVGVMWAEVVLDDVVELPLPVLPLTRDDVRSKEGDLGEVIRGDTVD